MKDAMSAMGTAFLNLIYPPVCYICHSRLNANCGLCRDCISGIHKYEFGISACVYEGVLKQALHIFKYRNGTALINAFSKLLLEFIETSVDISKIDTIIPVPLDSFRLRERGFNQAYLLSVPISKAFNIPISARNLVKKRHLPPQSSLKLHQRSENIKGAFSVRRPSALKGKDVLIVDDVYTTGATIKAASQALKRSGAAGVKAVTLARGA